MPGEINFSIHDEYTGVPIVESEESEIQATDEADGDDGETKESVTDDVDNDIPADIESNNIENLDEDSDIKETVYKEKTQENKDENNDNNGDGWTIW